MRLIKVTPTIDWIGKRRLFYAFSLTMAGLAIATFVVRRGPLFGLEFTGGTAVQVGFKPLPPVDEIRAALDAGKWKGYSLQTQPASNTAIIKLREGDQSKEDVSAKLIADLKAKFGDKVGDRPEHVEFIGPVIGRKFLGDTLWAVFGSFAGIVIYVAFRFKNWKWGAAGVIAIMHDVLISWGFLTAVGRETSLVTVAGILTLANYSIYDTIVIFDRVRENMRANRKENLKDVLNRSLNECLGRTLITSFTVFIAVVSLLVWGGEVLQDFTLTLTVGILLGVYSTTGVAIGLVYTLEERAKAGGA